MPPPLTNPMSVKLGFSIDKRTVSNLSYWRNMALYHDADAVIGIDGQEGTGKTVLAGQVGVFMDKDHEIDIETQVHFTSEQVLKYAKILPPGKVILYDESGEALDVSLAGSKKQRDMKQMFKEVRQRNLIFILVLPSFYDLQRFFAIHRTRALLHVYWKPKKGETIEENKFQRGFYRFYNESGKRLLYTTDKYRKHYLYPTSNKGKDLSIFGAKFPHHYVFDEALYRKKKKESSKSLNEGEKEESVDWKRKVVEINRELESQGKMKHGWVKAVAKLLGMERHWVSGILKPSIVPSAVKEMEEGIGNTTIHTKLSKQIET